MRRRALSLAAGGALAGAAVALAVAGPLPGWGVVEAGPVRVPPSTAPPGPGSPSAVPGTAAASPTDGGGTAGGRVTGPVRPPTVGEGTSTGRVPGTAARPARSRIDLDRWSLTVPVVGPKGVAENVRRARPYPPWLARNADGSLTFWAPVDGATTRGSQYARTELRETMRPPDTSVNWARTDPARLEATLRVEQLPAATRKIVVGQIHGYNVEDSSIGPLLLLYVVDGDLVVSLRDTPTGKSQVRSTVMTGLALGRAFSYVVDVRGAVVTVSVDGTERFRSPVTTAWDGVGLYFKAGVYLQASGGASDDGGRATFTALTVRH